MQVGFTSLICVQLSYQGGTGLMQISFTSLSVFSSPCGGTGFMAVDFTSLSGVYAVEIQLSEAWKEALSDCGVLSV